jgi:hypothetical protein
LKTVIFQKTPWPWKVFLENTSQHSFVLFGDSNIL